MDEFMIMLLLPQIVLGVIIIITELTSRATKIVSRFKKVRCKYGNKCSKIRSYHSYAE